MAKIAKYNGKVIKVGNKLGLHPSCCCEGPGCCPYEFHNVPYTIEFNCNGNIVNVNGTLFFNNGVVLNGPNRHSLQIICTMGVDPCNAFNLFTGYQIFAYRDIDCYAQGIYDFGFNPFTFTGAFCDPPQSPIGVGLEFNIDNCVGFPAGVNVTAKITIL